MLEQHQALARTLKLPLCSLGFGFTYIEMDDDELAPGIRKADLIRIGEAPQR